MTYGPNPWQQQSWDGRAAGNFIGGGAGCGLLVFATLAGGGGAARRRKSWRARWTRTSSPHSVLR